MEVGVNFPPFHSWCRTTFIGVLDGLLESGKSDIIDSNKDDKTHLKNNSRTLTKEKGYSYLLELCLKSLRLSLEKVAKHLYALRLS